MKKIGLYIHIPFCNGKCPYCDFYSIRNTESVMDEYCYHLNKKISECSQYTADTVYFGGGTPSLLGTQRILSLLDSIKKSFGDVERETTLEVNPESVSLLDFEKLHYYGVNRVSMGLQSSNSSELAALGRKHSAADAANAVNIIRRCGIDNISLDLMIGISGQTEETLKSSIDYCTSLEVKHISAYMLKIEEGTAYHKNRQLLQLPDDDTVCDFYELMINRLSDAGYHQYEISSFARQGFESRHNLKYWKCEEYLGIGSAAHSFIDKKRFYYGRSIKDFYEDKIICDGEGGTEEEFIAMSLRLNEGLSFKYFKDYFGYEIPDNYIKNAQRLKNTDLLDFSSDGFKLTTKGFLCSNSVIVEIIR